MNHPQLAPGIYTMAEAAYHADPCPVPSLSRSIARPLHASAQHPRLGGRPPDGPAAGEEDMDVGTAAHAMFLEGIDKAVLSPFDAYRSNAAKEWRAGALAEGKIPLKAHAYDKAHAVV